jgi:hypothetical protein
MAAGRGHDRGLDPGVRAAEPGDHLAVGQREQARLVREPAGQDLGRQHGAAQRRRNAVSLLGSHRPSQADPHSSAFFYLLSIAALIDNL